MNGVATYPVVSKSGSSSALDREQQTLLAQWIALKVMITEWNRPLEAFIPKEDRRAFMDNRIIPPYLEMWVISHDSEKWKGGVPTTDCLASVSRPETARKKKLSNGSDRFWAAVYFCNDDFGKRDEA
jgi:hypothetical protein